MRNRGVLFRRGSRAAWASGHSKPRMGSSTVGVMTHQTQKGHLRPKRGQEALLYGFTQESRIVLKMGTSQPNKNGAPIGGAVKTRLQRYRAQPHTRLTIQTDFRASNPTEFFFATHSKERPLVDAILAVVEVLLHRGFFKTIQAILLVIVEIFTHIQAVCFHDPLAEAPSASFQIHPPRRPLRVRLFSHLPSKHEPCHQPTFKP